VKEAIDPVGRVQDIVKNNASAPLQWLRSTVNYSHGTGSEDARTIYAILLRNLFTIYFILTLAGISAFGVMRLTADWIGCWVPATIHPPFVETGSKWAQIISPWWWLPLAVLWFGLSGGFERQLATRESRACLASRRSSSPSTRWTWSDLTAACSKAFVTISKS
jgi:hypothetical protein